uniref:Uncharacterized protein n=1 Tax=Candidatus Kentrum sp. LPFa TaxID=2126335 RepID=A0A450XL27_9GAMM|nr:MAG: hypothetical protein BECKLPF1236A_GA0070988_101249 [Candidatus Kentron sp. LPFa]VFK30001.1 MAG: hypothetical protein BECKLPF1236C_GA0070990_101009 [Candidatus Kentron sp. LPFa]
MLITFDFGGASLCHEILHFVQKSRYAFFVVQERGAPFANVVLSTFEVANSGPGTGPTISIGIQTWEYQ